MSGMKMVVKKLYTPIKLGTVLLGGKIRYSEIYNGEIAQHSTILEERKLPVEIISYDNNKLVSQECMKCKSNKKVKA